MSLAEAIPGAARRIANRLCIKKRTLDVLSLSLQFIVDLYSVIQLIRELGFEYEVAQLLPRFPRQDNTSTVGNSTVKGVFAQSTQCLNSGQLASANNHKGLLVPWDKVTIDPQLG